MKLFPTVTFIFFSLSTFGQSVENGIIDLRGSFQDNSTYTIDGAWEFYWNQLIYPGDFNSTEVEYADFPLVWNNLPEEASNKGEVKGYATYRVKVLLDPKIKYAIHTPAVYNSYRFYVNGELISENGQVGTTEESSKPFWSQLTKPLDRTIMKDTNEFVLQVSNFKHSRGGPVDKVVLGKQEVLLQSRSVLAVFDTILTGALIMGGLFFLGLFLFGRHQQSMLYFSVFCIVFSYYIFGSGNYVLHSLVALPWNLTIRLEYAAIYLTTILLIKFTESIYPDETPRFLVKSLIPIAAIYLVLVLFLPVRIFTVLHTYYLVVIFVVLIIGVYVYVKAAINKRIGSAYSLIGASFLLVVLILRVINHLYPLHLPVFIVPVGYMIFFFLHSLTLSQQFAMVWKQAKDDAEQALKAKSSFLSTMSHEIRTPMNAVIGLTNHLIEDNPKDRHVESLNTLKFSAQNLLVLINDILDFSKIEANKIEFDYQPVNIKQLTGSLAKVFEPIAKKEGLELIYDFASDVPENIKCDPTRTSQVLTNLLGNAIKFTKEGSVTLAMKLISKSENVCEIEFRVTDTGIGIAEDEVGKIFESFTQASSSTTREFGGTGLGLSITKRLLDLQGVNIFVESELGKGSSFIFQQYFEITEAPEAVEEKPARTPDVAALEADVLLVEDNEVNVMVAMKFLSKWGVNVEVAKNGEEALAFLNDNQYDVVLMDLQMPVMDGYTAVKEMRKGGNTTPVIALTASALPEERGKIFDVGMNDFVLKPFDPNTLLQAISKYAKNN